MYEEQTSKMHFVQNFFSISNGIVSSVERLILGYFS